MPLIIEGGRVPPRWAGKEACRRMASDKNHAVERSSVTVAFVNNMPDAALEDTEIQFFNLLEAAAVDIPVRVKLHSLPGVPRGQRGEQHLDSFYFDTDDLLNSQFDAVIITGTEPRQPNLRKEPYWPALANLLDWAQSHTISTILSCLAAHAGVLHNDGIERHPLNDKQFGVFDFPLASDHLLTEGVGQLVRFPHSRWNEVRSEALKACGYSVMTHSLEGGVDSFVKKQRQSLFVHFQGHPEYSAETLLREYRRDIRRFLRRERETYPSMPKGYFDAKATRLLTDFQNVLMSDRREELVEDFPESALLPKLQRTWESSARGIYGNWLRYVISKKADRSQVSVTAAFHRMEKARKGATCQK